MNLLECGVSIRADRAVLEVRGDDAAQWLQGQVTNDVRTTTVGGPALYAFTLNEKGRIVADLEIVRRADRFDLIVPRSELAELQARFDRVIIMEDVAIVERSDLTVVTVQGRQAAELHGPAASYACDRLGFGGHESIELVRDAETRRDELVRAGAAIGAVALDEAAWDRWRVVRGMPRYGVDFEHHLAQETGLAARAVSFGKGCYLGQEAVVMLEHRGKLPRRVMRVRVDGDATPGATLKSATGADAGTLTTWFPGCADGLAMLKREHFEIGTALALGDASVVVSSEPLALS